MTHTPHELAEDFPDDQDAMADLKSTNPHFAELAGKYHTINRAVHRAETDIAPTDDAHIAEMRRERLRLKDEIAGMLRKA